MYSLTCISTHSDVLIEVMTHVNHPLAIGGVLGCDRVITELILINPAVHACYNESWSVGEDRL